MKTFIRLYLCIFFSINISVHSQWFENNFPSNWHLRNASFIDQNTGFLISQGQDQLFITTNGTGTWDSILFNGLTVDVEFISALTGFVLIDSSGSFSVKSTTNGGNTWSTKALPP